MESRFVNLSLHGNVREDSHAGQFDRVTLDLLPQLEDDLDLHEKVSLVFLLYEGHVAEQRLAVTLAASGSRQLTSLLHDWAQSYGRRWQNTLVEALLVIQANSSVALLGLDVPSLQSHFLPTNLKTFHRIHPVKKVLYRLCESLTAAESKGLINKILEDERCDVRSDMQDFQYLELFILKLMNSKYISAGSWHPDEHRRTPRAKESSDVNTLIPILKDQDRNQIAEVLIYMQTYLNNNLTKETAFKPVKDEGVRLNESIDSSRRDSSMDRYYPIYDARETGLVLIINQVKFSSVFKKLDDRHGSDEDKKYLIETWKMYGFKEVILENATREDIERKLQELCRSGVKRDHSALVVCVMSHGEKGVVYDCDGEALAIHDIERLLSGAPSLAGKPKIIIIQACQGNNSLSTVEPYGLLKTDGNSNLLSAQSSEDVPEMADMLVFMATVTGHESFRHMLEGSWFIQTLCERLQKSGDSKSLTDICVEVNAKLSQKRTEDKRCQMSQYKTTFTKSLILKKIPI